MPAVDITNPRIIKFLLENYEKENRLRLNWINKHRERIQEAAVLNREPTNYFENDVLAHYMVGGLATITRDHESAGYNRRRTPIRDATFVPGINDQRHGYSIVDVGLGTVEDDPRLAKHDTDLTLDPLMRPVDPKITRIIHKPMPEFGREKYLEIRTKIWPEKKYYFAECVNWDYGWRMKDSSAYMKPMHGRVWQLTRTLRDRVGPAPDPSYYKAPDRGGYSKCQTNE